MSPPPQTPTDKDPATYPNAAKRGSPATVLKSTEDASPPAENSEYEIAAIHIKAGIDRFDDKHIDGWVFDFNNPNRRIWLELVLGNTILLRFIANQFRIDLKDAGIGGGYCSFSVAVPELVRESNLEDLKIRIANTDLYLLTKPSAVYEREIDAPDSMRREKREPARREAEPGAQRWLAQCVRAARLAELRCELEHWRDAIGSITSCCVEPPVSVSIHAFDEIHARYRGLFPELFRERFDTGYYVSEEFVVTMLPHCMMFHDGVLLVENTYGVFCISETIGHSTSLPAQFTNDFQELHKSSNSLYIEVTSRDVSKSYFPDDRINIILPRDGIANYAHWHIHFVPFVNWICLNAKLLLEATGTSGFRLFCHDPPTENGDGRVGLREEIIAALNRTAPVEIVDPGNIAFPVLLKNTIVSSTLNMDNGPLWAPCFASAFRALQLEADAEAPQLIYCNRSHAGSRGIANESELENALIRLGFTIVRPGELSYAQQRRVFSNARFIISSHGGALTNMIYSHARPLILELTHECYGREHHLWYRHLSAIMGGKHLPIICPVPDGSRERDFYEIFFQVDVGAVCDMVLSLQGEIDTSS